MQCSAVSLLWCSCLILPIYMHSTSTVSFLFTSLPPILTISPSLHLPFLSFLHLVSSFYLPYYLPPFTSVGLPLPPPSHSALHLLSYIPNLPHPSPPLSYLSSSIGYE